MEYAKKGALGGYKAVAEAEDYTHVLLTLEEYNGLQQKLRSAKNDAAAAQRDADRRARLADQQAAAAIQQKEDACKAALAKLQEELDLEREAREYQEGLNKALLRTARERANVDRGLRPKKQRSGYLVMSSREKELPIKNGRDRKTIIVWETVIQTPYSVEFNEAQVKIQTDRDLFTNKSTEEDEEHWESEKIGIDGIYLDSIEKLLLEDRHREQGKRYSEHNTVFSIKYNANFRAGFWELTLLHTQALSKVPLDMLPNRKNAPGAV